MPVYSKSVRASYKTDDMARMHQIGIAGNLYSDQYGDFPTRVNALVDSGILQPNVCWSLRDANSAGLANVVVAKLRQGRSTDIQPLPFKSSFLAYGDYGYTYKTYPQVVGASAGGWLINVLDSEVGPDEPSTWKGIYQRLTFEGSVVTRQHLQVPKRDGKNEGLVSSPLLLYQDATKEWQNQVLE